MTDVPTVSADNIVHSFGANDVLKGVSFDVQAGEVLALIGANGAGKSTLIKILSGVYPLQAGSISVEGQPFAPGSPLEARRHGLETVHQRIDEGVIPGLSVAENLLFEQIAQGELPAVLSMRQMIPAARDAAAGLGLEWDDATLRKDVYGLGIADQQLLILARALSRKPRMLVLDEPTSALSQAEVATLFDVIDRLRRSHVAIVYVSHRLTEIDRLADRVVVLRDGMISGQQQPPYDWRSAARDMLGDKVVRESEELVERRGSEDVLQMQGIQLFARSRPFDLDLRAEEVAGVIGLLGAGKSELARGVCGAESFHAGQINLSGKQYAPRSPRDAISRGVYLSSEDRAADSMLPGWSIARTVSLPFLERISPGGLLSARKECKNGGEVIDRFGVVAASTQQSVDALSGGNQQKVVVGRWLTANPQVMVLDEPFRGVDIGARQEISRRIRGVAADGAAVLVLSADIDEILEVADRIIVLVEGELQLDAYTSRTTRDEIIAKISEVV